MPDKRWPRRAAAALAVGALTGEAGRLGPGDFSEPNVPGHDLWAASARQDPDRAEGEGAAVLFVFGRFGLQASHGPVSAARPVSQAASLPLTRQVKVPSLPGSAREV